MEITGGLGADEVIECSGAEVVPEQSIRCVKKGGRIFLIGLALLLLLAFLVPQTVLLDHLRHLFITLDQFVITRL
ncbi:hypothetical protein D1BOALGB6SA_7763 [Olavius sp. associated proteobacterium Delta 1]|nr:hypothetical protein D1BOALGB6SA_7763 [Olavius sp. associated proteobacterium Delta 1]